MDNAKRRTWADLLVLIVSVWTIGEAIWGPSLLPQASQDQGASATYVISIIAGGVGLLGAWLAQKRRGAGQLLVAVAGIALLVAPFTYRRGAPLPMIFAGVSGLLLLLAAKFVGPVPPPAGKIEAASSVR